MTDLPPLRLPITHKGIAGTSSQGCQMVGLYCVQRLPDTSESADRSSCFRLPDGTTPDPQYNIRCGMCGHDMAYDVLVFIHYVWPRMKRAEAKAFERRN